MFKPDDGIEKHDVDGNQCGRDDYDCRFGGPDSTTIKLLACGYKKACKIWASHLAQVDP